MLQSHLQRRQSAQLTTTSYSCHEWWARSSLSECYFVSSVFTQFSFVFILYIRQKIICIFEVSWYFFSSLSFCLCSNSMHCCFSWCTLHIASGWQIHPWCTPPYLHQSATPNVQVLTAVSTCISSLRAAVGPYLSGAPPVYSACHKSRNRAGD